MRDAIEPFLEEGAPGALWVIEAAQAAAGAAAFASPRPLQMKGWAALCDRILAGESSARGFRRDSHTPELLDPHFVWDADPDFDRDTLSLAETVISGVRIFEAAAENVTPKANSTDQGQISPRAKGGAPAKYEWDDFIREMIRAVWYEGLPDRSSFLEHMRDWCEREWGGVAGGGPDPRTVKRRFDHYCPQEPVDKT